MSLNRFKITSVENVPNKSKCDPKRSRIPIWKSHWSIFIAKNVHSIYQYFRNCWKTYTILEYGAKSSFPKIKLNIGCKQCSCPDISDLLTLFTVAWRISWSPWYSLFLWRGNVIIFIPFFVRDSHHLDSRSLLQMLFGRSFFKKRVIKQDAR